MESFVPSSSPLSAEELTAYVGPRAERYRARFERFTRTGTTRFELSWNNPAAFSGCGGTSTGRCTGGRCSTSS